MSNQHWFTLWQYLNQPLFDSEIKLTLNPKEFWQDYRIEFLYRCWQQHCEHYCDPHF
ncbi:MAG: hypothetical protein HC792_00065 [Acaryochloridaceae cyanobacterium CSU_5_19]|nr:hypothetical protein [Acaryochloridaceae cyanobacterium CSU_5_19]